MATQKIRKKSAKTITPRDYMSSTPVFKFPPMPTKDYMVVYRSTDSDLVFAEPVDFVAVCEWSSEWSYNGKEKKDIHEGICFMVLARDGSGFFDIICPDNMSSVSNRLGVIGADTLYWVNAESGEPEPIYKWDFAQDAFVHPIAGKISGK